MWSYKRSKRFWNIWIVMLNVCEVWKHRWRWMCVRFENTCGVWSWWIKILGISTFGTLISWKPHQSSRHKTWTKQYHKHKNCKRQHHTWPTTSHLSHHTPPTTPHHIAPTYHSYGTHMGQKLIFLTQVKKSTAFQRPVHQHTMHSFRRAHSIWQWRHVKWRMMQIRIWTIKKNKIVRLFSIQGLFCFWCGNIINGVG